MTTVLLLGSGPTVTTCRDWPRRPWDRIVAINNAWRVRDDWDDLVVPEDFPPGRRPDSLRPGQRLIEADAFVPAQNAYGGFVYAGGTMAFTAAYWALHSLKPRRLAFLGCDMVYPASGATHFYGTGSADPLRADVTLRSLEAKSARLMILAARQGCIAVNLSQGDSRLILPRARPESLPDRAAPYDAVLVEEALTLETKLDYHVASGRYWEQAGRFDIAEIDRLDALWLAAAAR